MISLTWAREISRDMNNGCTAVQNDSPPSVTCGYRLSMIDRRRSGARWRRSSPVTLVRVTGSISQIRRKLFANASGWGARYD